MAARDGVAVIGETTGAVVCPVGDATEAVGVVATDETNCCFAGDGAGGGVGFVADGLRPGIGFEFGRFGCDVNGAVIGGGE